jgi:hypothetical protein
MKPPNYAVFDPTMTHMIPQRLSHPHRRHIAIRAFLHPNPPTSVTRPTSLGNDHARCAPSAHSFVIGFFLAFGGAVPPVDGDHSLERPPYLWRRGPCGYYIPVTPIFRMQRRDVALHPAQLIQINTPIAGGIIIGRIDFIGHYYGSSTIPAVKKFVPSFMPRAGATR